MMTVYDIWDRRHRDHATFQVTEMMLAGRIAVLGVALGLTCLVARDTHADIFVLGTGGEVRGELANADQEPRSTFVIEPSLC